MKHVCKILGSVALAGGLFLLAGCAGESDASMSARVDALTARVNFLEGQMQTTLQAAQAAERNAAQAREATDRMYRSGLRK